MGWKMEVSFEFFKNRIETIFYTFYLERKSPASGGKTAGLPVPGESSLLASNQLAEPCYSCNFWGSVFPIKSGLDSMMGKIPYNTVRWYYSNQQRTEGK